VGLWSMVLVLSSIYTQVIPLFARTIYIYYLLYPGTPILLVSSGRKRLVRP